MWIFFSILAALCWAIVNTIDKYVLTKWVRKPIVPVMILGVTGLVASICVILLHGLNPMFFQNITLAFIVGIFYVLMIVFYFKAVNIEEISRVIPLFYLSPLFVLILSFFFLGEIFSPIKYLGIFLLVIGAILISLKKPFRISFGKAFWFMVLVSLIAAVNAVITKYLLNFADFWTIFSYKGIGAFFATIPIFYFNFSDLVLTIREHGKKVILAMSANEALNQFALLFIIIATSIGYVTLVNALSSVQPFFVLLFTVVLSVFYPKILKEEINKTVMFQKLIAIILMFVGVMLIT